MDSGLTAEAIGTTTGRTTGMRASFGRQACTTPTSKPTSLTCWPKPARSRSTEGTELPMGDVRISQALVRPRTGCGLPIGPCTVPSNESVLLLGGASLSQPTMRLKENFWRPLSPPIMALGGGGASTPFPHPALDKSFFSMF